jgi:hypothetical protein
MTSSFSTFQTATLALACLAAPLTSYAQTEVQWWHSMTAVNGE